MSTDTVQALLRSVLAQHSAWLFRASTGAVNTTDKHVLISNDAFVSMLNLRLLDLSAYERACLVRGEYSTADLRALRDDISAWVDTFKADTAALLHAAGVEHVAHEAEFARMLLHAVTEDVKQPSIDAEAVWAIAVRQPIVGKLYGDMLDDLGESAARRALQEIRAGISDGRTTPDIVRALRGTKANGFSDGKLNQTRTETAALVRTTRTHLSSEAYQRIYASMGVTHVVVCAVLDGRTSLYCATHDGMRYRLGTQFPTPPYHYNCRTVLLPDIGSAAFKVRPFVASKHAAANMSAAEQDATIGQTTNQTYAQWFADQSAAFQKEWLGPTRYLLYKKGGYPLDRFTDPRGAAYTIEQLRARDAATFEEIFPRRGTNGI